MPRANRYTIEGQVWHLTQRCHNQQWLLKFSRDRLRWIHWLFKARQRFGLCVLNYMVTSNHVHLLVQDQGRDEMPKSMQLVAGRTAQEYNRRKNRQGAFWEDRYHATAIQTDRHLARCMTYIDLNMVRAGAVGHPLDWHYCGFYEIHNPPHRKGRLDTDALLTLFEHDDMHALAEMLKNRTDERLTKGSLEREAFWSEAVMIGDKKFIRQQLVETKFSHPGLAVDSEDNTFLLREPRIHYFVQI